MPRVSIVVTCYNYAEFVSDCLSSIAEQTFNDFEVIIVDDGSTDGSVNQIRPFLKDRRFRYIFQQNRGQASAKNRGLADANGDLVALFGCR